MNGNAGSGLMAGKRGLIMGLANDKSLAWGIAKKLAEHGAELAFSYQGDALAKRVIPLAAQRPQFDPVQDFDTIARVAVVGLSLVAHPGVPVRDLKSLIDLVHDEEGPLPLNEQSCPKARGEWNGDTSHKGEPSRRAKQGGSPEGTRSDVPLHVAA